MICELKQPLALITGMPLLFMLCLIAMPDAAFAYGIDDMMSSKWRVGTFLFLVFSMALYAFFVVLYMRNARGKLKKGESILLWSILGGVLLGFIISFVQFVEGFLL